MTNPNAPQNWMYFKLYLGASMTRCDQVLIHLAQMIESQILFDKWFYIRYFDDTGFHVRIRLLPVDGNEKQASDAANVILATLIKKMTSYPASTYLAMVTPPGMSSDTWMPPGKDGGRSVPDQYAPEHEKYGGKTGMPIAEQLFMHSSQIAVAVMADEAAERYSRKTLVPCLMRACLEAFRPAPTDKFWNQYSLFWLGGDSPAAQDWRQKFLAKGEELRSSGVPVCTSDAELHPSALAHLNKWRSALAQARSDYDARQGEHGATLDVLCFNFVHLMNNRLGLTSLEEPFMGTLLEQCEYGVTK
jgi:thiopeptide-type bacteriocin biosynthesis protein